MVSSDPQLEVHSKINTRGAREYHVQFFSNQPERAWVHEKRVREYKGHEQYEELLAEAAKQASNHSEKQKVLQPANPHGLFVCYIGDGAQGFSHGRQAVCC